MKKKKMVKNMKFLMRLKAAIQVGKGIVIAIVISVVQFLILN